MKKILYIISIVLLFVSVSFAYTSYPIKSALISVGSTFAGADSAAELAHFDIILMNRLKWDDVDSNTFTAVHAINAATKFFIYQLAFATIEASDGGAASSLNNIARWDTVYDGDGLTSLDANHADYFMLNDSEDTRIYIGASEMLLRFADAAPRNYWITATLFDIVGRDWEDAGVFGDNNLVILDTSGADMLSKMNDTPEADYDSNAEWFTAIQNQLNAYVSGLGAQGQLYIPNVGDSSRWSDADAQYTAIDGLANSPYGMLIEAFTGDQWGAGGTKWQIFGEAEWKNQIDVMAGMGNVRTIGALRTPTLSSIEDSGTDSRDNAYYGYDALWYVLGSYFMGRDSAGLAHVAFGWSYSTVADIMDELDALDLGLPVGAYTQDYDGNDGLYAREYERAWVFVNPSLGDIADINRPEAWREITHGTINTAWDNLSVSGATFTLNEGRAKIFIKETAAILGSPLNSITVGTNQITVGTNQIEIVE